MIRVEKIHIEDFRGIRDLTLTFDGRNFGVCGPNGTGKSGIVDAIEFGLTGNVSRLSGEGTGDVSIQKHGPHVDSRDRPDKARVVLTLTIPSLKKTVTIDRTVKNANKPTITPNDSAVDAVLAQVGLHPEFVLSRRELISYVITTPGNRSAEVQALLRLDQVDKVRGILSRIANASAKEASSTDGEQRRAADALVRALEIAQLNGQKVLEAANGARSVLGLPSLAALTATTSLTEGLSTSDAAPQSKIAKAQATADIQALRTALSAVTSEKARADQSALLEQLSALASEGDFAEGAERDQLLQTALKLFDDETCPVCETPWKPEDFRKHIGSRREQLAEIAKRRSAIETELAPIIATTDELLDVLRSARKLATQVTPAIETTAFDAFGTILSAGRKQLVVFTP